MSSGDHIGDEMSKLQTKKGRENWEERFSKTHLAPILQVSWWYMSCNVIPVENEFHLQYSIAELGGDACLPGIQMVADSILWSGKTFYRGDWSWNAFYGHFSPYRWFK